MNTFTTQQIVTIDRVNYGGHVGHDSLITMMHQARIDFFASFNQSEVDFFGNGLILKSLSVDYHQELFCGDRLNFDLNVLSIDKLRLKLSTHVRNNHQSAADATMLFLCFDYQCKKIAKFSQIAIDTLKKI